MASLVGVKKKTLSEKTKILDALSDSINKKAGKVVVGRIGDNEEILEKLRIKFVPTPSLELNEATGGGFPISKVSIVTGLPDSGKVLPLLTAM